MAEREGIYISQLPESTILTDNMLFATDNGSDNNSVSAAKLAEYVNKKIDVAGQVNNGVSEANSYTDTKKTETVNEVKEWSQEAFSNKNLLIGGDCQVWQRGTSFKNIPAASFTYTADRFGLFSQGLCDVEKDGFWIKTTFNNNAVNSQSTVIEIPDSLLGKTVTLSFYAKANKILQSQIYAWNGITFVNAIAMKDIVLNENEQRYSLTFTIPSNLTNNFLYIWFARVNGVSDGTIVWLGKCKLELGEIATPFVPRPYGEELVLCQCYYQIRSTNNISAVDMRPSMRISSPTITQVSNGYAYDAEIY